MHTVIFSIRRVGPNCTLDFHTTVYMPYMTVYTPFFRMYCIWYMDMRGNGFTQN
jgi:hypothetical protein